MAKCIRCGFDIKNDSICSNCGFDNDEFKASHKKVSLKIEDEDPSSLKKKKLYPVLTFIFSLVFLIVVALCFGFFSPVMSVLGLLFCIPPYIFSMKEAKASYMSFKKIGIVLTDIGVGLSIFLIVWFLVALI